MLAGCSVQNFAADDVAVCDVCASSHHIYHEQLQLLRYVFGLLIPGVSALCREVATDIAQSFM